MMPWNVSGPSPPQGWALWYTLTSLDATLATLQEELFVTAGPTFRFEPDWLRAYA